MSETDPDQLADELEHEADELERRQDELQHRADEVREDWKRKRSDPSVPGAVPEAGDEAEKSQ